MAEEEAQFGIKHNSQLTLSGGNPRLYFLPGVVTKVPGSKEYVESIVMDFNNASYRDNVKMEVVEVEPEEVVTDEDSVTNDDE